MPTRRGWLIAVLLVTVSCPLMGVVDAGAAVGASSQPKEAGLRSTDPEFTYYVDSPMGSDQNDGRTPATAWKTLGRLQAAPVMPGQSIGLRRGSEWRETLQVAWSGLPDEPITIGAYGDGTAPTIDGAGVRTDGVVGVGRSDIQLRGLRIVGWTQRGVFDWGGDRWVIEDTQIAGGDSVPGSPDMAVLVRALNGVHPTGTVVSHNQFGPIGVPHPAQDPTSIFWSTVLFQGVDDSSVVDNTFSCGNAVAIRLDYGTPQNNVNNIVARNDIRDCASGVMVLYSDDTRVAHNIISNGRGLGISAAYGSERTVIDSNVIEDITGTPTLFNGIDISGGARDGWIIGNRVQRVARHSIVFAADNGGPAGRWHVQGNLLDASGNSTAAGNQLRLPLGIRASLKVNENRNVFVGYAADPSQPASTRQVVGIGENGSDLLTMSQYQARTGQGNASISTESRQLGSVLRHHWPTRKPPWWCGVCLQ